jgi:hypothetical protein
MMQLRIGGERPRQTLCQVIEPLARQRDEALSIG